MRQTARSGRNGSGESGPARHAARPEIDPIVVRRSRDLLERAQMVFDNADAVPDDPERFRQFYLAALRAAGAALAIYEPPGRPVRRVSANAWSRISATVPALSDFAARFADLSRTRMEIESGIRRSIDPAAAARLRREVVAFLAAVEDQLIAYEQGRLAHQAVDRIGRSA
ncbi:SAV_6107 family HEPN domain-containing protein [Gordonia sp. NPDC003425]